MRLQTLWLTFASASLVACRETLEDAAKNVRSLVAEQSIGTLASVFPASGVGADAASSHSFHNPSFVSTSAPHLAGHAFALPEYYAPCYPTNGSLLLIMFRISQNAQNILFDSPSLEILSSTSSELQAPMDSQTGWKKSGRASFVVQELPLAPSPVSRPRVSFMGNVTLLSDLWLSVSGDGEGLGEGFWEGDLASCYLAYHPDARWWIPGQGTFHDVAWARFDPEAIYYVGGFGGEHYIGYIPVELYQESG